MRTIGWLIFGAALLGGAAEGSAQENNTATVRPGYIGIRYDHEAFVVGMHPSKSNEQVVVKAVSKDSPAEKAGLRVGDEILRINGLSAANGKFAAVARTLTEGDTVRLRVKRDGKEREYTVVAAGRPAGYHTLLGDRMIFFSPDSVRGLMKMYFDSARVHLDSMKLPRIWMEHGDSAFNIRIQRFGGPGDTLLFGHDSAGIRRLHGKLLDEVRSFEGELGPGGVFRSFELGHRSIAGAEFTELDPGMKTYFGTDRGLLTLRVVPETPAARAGLQSGDIVVKANDRTVTTVTDLRGALFAQTGALKIEVVRKGATKKLEIQTQRK
jgi:membrane-associated protease RseP (regulator of RpoE activity)